MAHHGGSDDGGTHVLSCVRGRVCLLLGFLHGRRIKPKVCVCLCDAGAAAGPQAARIMGWPLTLSMDCSSSEGNECTRLSVRHARERLLALLASMVCCGCCCSQTMCGSLAYVRLRACVDGRRNQGSIMNRRVRAEAGEYGCE